MVADFRSLISQQLEAANQQLCALVTDCIVALGTRLLDRMLVLHNRSRVLPYRVRLQRKPILLLQTS